jgi:hypothetical protein
MCALIYPQKEGIGELPYAEKIIYEVLEKLSDQFIIFHSVQWMKKSNKWKSTWKENDFLILNRNRGALVLEVKGGDIVYKDRAFHQTNTTTGEVSILEEKKKKDPLSQAVDGIYHYRKAISNIERYLDDRFPIEAAVWFPSCKIDGRIKDFPLNYREAAGAILDYESIAKGPQAIYDVFDFYNSREKVNITNDEFKKIIEMIASDFELITAPGSKKSELDHAFLKLTNEQAGLLDYISEQRIATVQGVAGTGKTLVAKEAARRFGAEGRKVLFLCFNRFLFMHLVHSYPYENVTYLNIHSLITKYGKDAGDLSRPKDRAQALQSIKWDYTEFNDVIIDEGQDFDNDEILHFKEYCHLVDGHFLVFYDKHQMLTTKEVPKWVTESECKLVLTKNCRNTREIALTSYNVIDVELNQKITMVNGEQTTISFVKGAPEMKLVNLIKYFTSDAIAYEYSDIVILTVKTEDESILSDKKKISGIPISRERNGSSIFFTTASKFKGLESKVIIIIDIDERVFSDDEKKRVFYVACSRATHRLALFVNGDESKINSIANSINGSKGFASQAKVVMKTQSKILEL